uniref:Uncharacterized protein n=1 Tax=Anguilla anguilla TaxID=7936 RepID=A0A0E9SB67_ANGAN
MLAMSSNKTFYTKSKRESEEEHDEKNNCVTWEQLCKHCHKITS